MKKYLSATLIIVTLFTVAPAHLAYSKEAKNPYGTGSIDPAGPNEIILTITKGARKVDFAYPRLLKMKQERISIYEPFLKKRQSFSVIPLKNLFSFLAISGSDIVTTVALNDYVFTESAEKFNAAGAYIAIKVNGKAIGYDQGGPIRLVYGEKSIWAKNLDAWNWSLVTIRVR